MLPKIITTQQGLEEICTSFLSEASPFICIDTEFVRQTTYWPKLALIQMASLSHQVIIDPVPGLLCLKPLLEILRSPSIVKVFHSGRQDLEIFWHLFKELPSPIFDTQIAAAFLGMGTMGYDRLVNSLLGIEIDKTSQHTNWLKRPLSEKQLKYALDDVLYMRQMYPILFQKLDEKGRTDWMQDELAVLTSEKTYQSNPDTLWRDFLRKVRNWKQLSLLKDFLSWREEMAILHNLNRSGLIHDKELSDLSQSPLLPKEDLRRFFKRLAPRLDQADFFESFYQVYESAYDLIGGEGDAAKKRKEEMESALKKAPSMMPEALKEKITKIKDVLNGVASGLEIPAHFIASRFDIESFAKDPSESHKILSGWRRSLLEDKLKIFLNQAGG